MKAYQSRAAYYLCVDTSRIASNVVIKWPAIAQAFACKDTLLANLGSTVIFYRLENFFRLLSQRTKALLEHINMKKWINKKSLSPFLAKTANAPYRLVWANRQINLLKIRMKNICRICCFPDIWRNWQCFKDKAQIALKVLIAVVLEMYSSSLSVSLLSSSSIYPRIH